MCSNGHQFETRQEFFFPLLYNLSTAKLYLVFNECNCTFVKCARAEILDEELQKLFQTPALNNL